MACPVTVSLLFFSLGELPTLSAFLQLLALLIYLSKFMIRAAELEDRIIHLVRLAAGGWEGREGRRGRGGGGGGRDCQMAMDLRNR